MKRIYVFLLSLFVLSMSACSFGNDEGNDTEKGTFVNPHYETEAEVCLVHDLVDGLCKNCGDDMPESQGLSYELVELEEGSAYAVNGLGTCKDTQVRIPAYYNDLPVVSLITLGESSDVTSVVIGENVVSMERGALFGLSSLKGLTVLAPSIALPSSCFESLSIESVILPEGLTEIPVGAFQGCGSLRRIHIPSTVTVIGDQAFSDCRLLREINFPDGLENIGHSAFKGIVSLHEVTLPSSLKSVGNGAFSKCNNLKTVHYNGDIATWCMINFEMNGNPMINGADFYVGGEKVVDLRIPEGVNKPGDFSFQGCGSIESVVCPASMTELTLGMFMGCTNLTEAVFLGEIKTPGVMHFAGCTSLSDIYLNNAPEDFQVGPQFSTEAEVHYKGTWAVDDYNSLGKIWSEENP